MTVSTDYHVTVQFGKGFEPRMQGPILLRLEMWLREQGFPAEVFKQVKPDDSKLRSLMTVKEREAL